MYQGGSLRRTARLRSLYTDKRRGNHLFDNLHHLETAPQSEVGEAPPLGTFPSVGAVCAPGLVDNSMAVTPPTCVSG